MPKIAVEIEGVSPLLQHRFPMEEADAKAKKKMGTVDYSKEAETSLYRDEKGKIYVPSTHLEAAMRDAAVNFRIQGGRGKTYKAIVNAAIIVEPEAIPLLGENGGDPEWTTDARPVVVQRARVVRYRPKFGKWKLLFTINVLDEQLDVETINKILVHAGQYNGIGDFRPKFGRFIVTQFTPV